MPASTNLRRAINCTRDPVGVFHQALRNQSFLGQNDDSEQSSVEALFSIVLTSSKGERLVRG
jgi:hypothetical protein